MISPWLLIVFILIGVLAYLVWSWRKITRESNELEERIDRYIAGDGPMPKELEEEQKHFELDVPDAVSESERLETIDNWLAGLYEKGKFNGTAVIARDGQALLTCAFGKTDHTGQCDLTPQSMMRLASVSKQFTAAAILVLVEREKLGLDQVVSEIIDGFPYEDVTVRHLLNQTSGFPDSYMDLANEHKKQVGKFLTIQKTIELLNQFGPPASGSPNEQYEYSNTNYVLLAGIVEVVSGRSFEDFMREELFTPLGLPNTRVWNLASPDSDFPNQTASFMQILGPNKSSWLVPKRIEMSPDFLDGVAGDGGVFSSVEDLVRWNEFWNGNALVSAGLLDQAFREPTLNDGTKSDYGFGWVIEEDGAWHNGSWLGANTFTTRNTNAGIHIAVLDNSMNHYVDNIGLRIKEVISQEV